MGDSRSTTPVLSKSSFNKLHSLMNSISNELGGNPTTVQSYTSGSSLNGVERWSRFQFSALETSLGRLQRDQRISGFLLKLGTTATAATSNSSISSYSDPENKVSWLQRFLLLTPFAELFLFRTNTLSSSNAPVTYLCVDACRGSYNDAHDAWLLEVSGDGVGAVSGRIEKVAWIIKCPNEAVLNMWLRELSDVIRTVEEKFPQYAAAARKADRVVDLVVEYDRPPVQQKKAAAAVVAVAAVAAVKSVKAADVQRRGDSLDFDVTRKSVRIGQWRGNSGNLDDEDDQNGFISETTGGKEVKRSLTAPLAANRSSNLKGSLKKVTISPDDARGGGNKKEGNASGQALRRSASHTPSIVQLPHVPNPVQMISIRKSFGKLKDAKGGWFTWLSKK
ncbi:hypothetical protein HK100_011327 [Physocladia obscura]|uniref:PH domain-containing protein n=1 Tax=Physocladia obscura TaxID=109957 RepID=A0AAD5TB81_9FUNG|nr:hypothetical protein HK100_011327 [Physocladia obscura]